MFGGPSALLLATWLALAPSSALAEPLSAPQDQAQQVPTAAATDGDNDEVQSVDVNSLDWSQLNVDAYTLVHGLAPKPRTATLNAGESPAWSSKPPAAPGRR